MADTPITRAEVDAYMDGELGLPERLAVEDSLARDPAAAAALMADLRNRTALRMMIEPAGPSAARASRAAVTRGRALRHSALAFAGGAAALAGALALLPHQEFERTPWYVSDAVESYRTGLLRAGMVSQIETPILDARDIEHSTRIRVPRLPRGWRITDVQIFPSDEGPALQIMIRTPAASTVSIFATHGTSNAPASPVTVRQGAAAVAYWREDDTTYALTGTEPAALLTAAAVDIAGGIG